MASFIMASPLQALCFVVLFSVLGLFLPIIGLLSSAAIGLVTLRLGWKNGLQTALPASLILIVMAFLLQNNPLVSLLPALMQWLLVLFLASMLQVTSSWRQVLTTIMSMAIAGTLLFHLVVSDVGAFWKTLMQPLAELEIMQQQLQLSGINMEQVIDTAAGLATGLAAALLSLGLIIALMMARHWQALLYNPDGFRQELRELRLPRPAGLMMITLITLGLLTGFPLIIDVILAGMTVFLFQGIGLVNNLHHQRNMHRGWMIGFYVFLALMPIRFGLLLATFGIIDSVADFRTHLAKKNR